MEPISSRTLTLFGRTPRNAGTQQLFATTRPNDPEPAAAATQTDDTEAPNSGSLKRARNITTQASLDLELIARKWLKANGYYMAKHADLRNTLFHHFMSVMRQPRGRADKAGSQQAAFSMEIPSRSAAIELMQGAPPMGKKKYTINAEGSIEWKDSPSISTWYFDRHKPMAKWLKLHRRGLGVACYGASKAVPPTGGYEASNVVLTLIPPLIMELCERSLNRLVLEVTVNLMTFNDDGVPKLPPAFPYEPAQVQNFTTASRYSIFEMHLRGHPMSERFLGMVTDEEQAIDSEEDDE